MDNINTRMKRLIAEVVRLEDKTTDMARERNIPPIQKPFSLLVMTHSENNYELLQEYKAVLEAFKTSVERQDVFDNEMSAIEVQLRRDTYDYSDPSSAGRSINKPGTQAYWREKLLGELDRWYRAAQTEPERAEHDARVTIYKQRYEDAKFVETRTAQAEPAAQQLPIQEATKIQAPDVPTPPLLANQETATSMLFGSIPVSVAPAPPAPRLPPMLFGVDTDPLSASIFQRFESEVMEEENMRERSGLERNEQGKKEKGFSVQGSGMEAKKGQSETSRDRSASFKSRLPVPVAGPAKAVAENTDSRPASAHPAPNARKMSTSIFPAKAPSSTPAPITTQTKKPLVKPAATPARTTPSTRVEVNTPTKQPVVKPAATPAKTAPSTRAQVNTPTKQPAYSRIPTAHSVAPGSTSRNVVSNSSPAAFAAKTSTIAAPVFKLIASPPTASSAKLTTLPAAMTIPVKKEETAMGRERERSTSKADLATAEAGQKSVIMAEIEKLKATNAEDIEEWNIIAEGDSETEKKDGEWDLVGRW